jgi:putative NIF3 family GTP cyclohydrolase 1 type 2
MKRRNFVRTSGTAALGIGVIPPGFFMANRAETMTVKELNTYLRSLVQVEEPSVDKIIIGDPDIAIRKIGTAWMPYWATLKEAHAQGVNAMVVHEPTFYTHRDLEETQWDWHAAPARGKEMYSKQVEAKKHWILENGIAVIRCHDVLDKIKGYGIPFAFGRGLGFQDSDILRSRMHYNVYRTEEQPAGVLAKQMAVRLKEVGQPGIAFYGDPDYPVRSVGVGTGCICDPMNYMDLEMDLAIAIDDSVSTWIQTTYAEDTGRPLVVVNHGTSEEFGMRELSARLNESLKFQRVIHFQQGCSYQWVTA